MAFFSRQNREEISNLERVLSGIPVSTFNLNYNPNNIKVGTEGENRSSPVCLLYVENVDQIIRGFIQAREEFFSFPLGFSNKPNFLGTQYYLLNEEGNFVPTQKNNDVLYLPLRKTPIKCAIGQRQGERFIPSDGSPFTIMGVEKDNTLLPLAIVSETDDGLTAKGLYLNGRNVSSYDCILGKEKKEQLREWTQRFVSLRPSVSPKSQIVVPEGNAIRGAPNLNLSPDPEVDWEDAKSIVRYLDATVIGQGEAKITVATTFCSYMTRVRTGNQDLPSDNILLVGGTGTGKTLMLSTLAKKAQIPFISVKLTDKSSEGYKGENLSSVFERLRPLVNGEEAPYGLIFFDEIDKLAKDDVGTGRGFGNLLMNQLIGWLDPEGVIMGSGDGVQKEARSPLYTRNLLFATAGAFSGNGDSLLDIIAKRKKIGQKSIGFGSNGPTKASGNLLYDVRPEDVIQYGVKPELVGRLPIIAVLDPLTVDDKIRILTESKRSALRMYTNLMALKGYELQIGPEVPRYIAEVAPVETGARALNAICGDLFAELIFDPKQYAHGKIIKVDLSLARQLINHYGKID